jgi:HPt (histidine-containing phosphotransfer) domain-containing protein
MTNVDFDEQIARVRARFATSLPGKIADSFADLEKMSSGGAETIDTVVVFHRRLHEIRGIAPTLGFQATGEVAGAASTAIREAAKAKRAATADEIAALKTELEQLRKAASGELQDFSQQPQ